MSDVTSNGVPMTVDDKPQAWTAPSVSDVFIAGVNDLDAGLAQFPGELPFFNRDLEDKLFVFCSVPEVRHEDEKTVKNVTISEQDVIVVMVALYNEALNAFEAPREAKLNGGWIVPQILNLSYLQLSTRPWTLSRNPEKPNRPWMLARPDYTMLRSAKGAKPASPAGPVFKTMEYDEFEIGFTRLGYTRERVLELIGKSDFRGVDLATTLKLLERQTGVAEARENVGKKAPKVHA